MGALQRCCGCSSVDAATLLLPSAAQPARRIIAGGYEWLDVPVQPHPPGAATTLEFVGPARAVMFVVRDTHTQLLLHIQQAANAIRQAMPAGTPWLVVLNTEQDPSQATSSSASAAAAAPEPGTTAPKLLKASGSAEHHGSAASVQASREQEPARQPAAAPAQPSSRLSQEEAQRLLGLPESTPVMCVSAHALASTTIGSTALRWASDVLKDDA